ncbi:MAG: 3-hydroxyacyl-ACP dehydratase FabZ [Thermodesulfobacteriota bacterium]
MKENDSELACSDIIKLLPHRYPFLLIDRVVEFESLQRLIALKNVTINEPFFQGHFPGFPVMPGVLIIESLAQAGAVLVLKSSPEQTENKIFLFSGIEKMRFRKPVYPGETLYLHVEYLKNKMNLWKMEAKALVEDQIAAQGVLTASLVDTEE